jgi:serine/threonine protein phosphatase PrpC
MDLLRRIFGLHPKENEDTERPLPAGNEMFEPVESLDLEAMEPPIEPEDTHPLQTRPLDLPQPFQSTSRRIEYGQASDVGQVRENNQDACLTMVLTPELTDSPPPIGVFIVADGMGGHHDGELASAIAVQTIARRVVDDIIGPHLDGPSERSSDQMTIPEVLAEAMSAANIAVQQRVPDGGTTATCAIVRGDLAYIAHVGDSRAYLISEGNMELITRDHSLVRRLQELGRLTSEEAEVHPQRNVLYRALGQGDTMDTDASTRRLPPGSRLLLCSDGMWGVVGDERIAAILAEVDNPQEACDLMVEEANVRGGPDNITAVLMQMPN